MVSHVDHHLGVAITREAAILHAVEASPAELTERSSALRILFLKVPVYLLDRQGSILSGIRGGSYVLPLGKRLTDGRQAPTQQQQTTHNLTCN